MAFRKAAQSAGRRLARQARSLSVAPRSLLITETLAAEASASRAPPTQLSFSKSFAAAAEPAAAPAASESTGYVSQVMSRPRSRVGADCDMLQERIHPVGLRGTSYSRHAMP